MESSPTAVSLAGAAIYLCVSALCVLAWRIVAEGVLEGRQNRSGWLAIAVFFAFLALSRIFVIEDRFDDFLRQLARESGAYEGRTAWQAPLSVLAILAVLFVLAVLARSWARGKARIAHEALGIAQLGAVGMLGLIVLRLISFHPVDSLLYGGLRLNWWIDIALSLLVGGAAWTAWRSPRS